MRINYLVPFSLIGTLACNEPPQFVSSTVNGPERVTAADAVAENGETEDSNEEVEYESKSYELRLEGTDSLVNNGKVLDIIFLIDDSRSMAEKIQKLADSIRTFVAKMKNESIKFNGVFLTYSDFLKQLKTHEEGFEHPFGLVSGLDKKFLQPVYNRGESLESLYVNAYRFNHETQLDEVQAELKKIANRVEGSLVYNEPGFCAAMDVFTWTANRYSAYPGVLQQLADKIHMVFLSDEDNTEKLAFSAVDPTKVRNLYCGVNRKTQDEANLSCNRYEVAYKSYQRCLPGEDLVKVFANRQCRSERSDCQKEDFKWRCEAGDYSKSNLSSPYSSQSRSLVYDVFQCEIPIDGVPVLGSYSRASAKTYDSMGFPCSADTNGGSSHVNHSSGTNPFGLVPGSTIPFTCDRYSVTTNKRNQDPGKVASLEGQGFTCSPNGTFDYEKKHRVTNSDYAGFRVTEIGCPGGYTTSPTNREIGIMCASLASQLPEGFSTGQIAASSSTIKTTMISSANPLSNSEIEDKFYKQFNRQDNTIVSITAAADSSGGTQCSNPNALRSSFLEGNIEGFKTVVAQLPSKPKVTVHSIVHTDPNFCGESVEGEEVGKAYMALSAETDGIVQSICSPDFDEFVTKLAKKVVATLERNYDLPADAKELLQREGTVLSIKVGDQTLVEGKDFSIENGVIKFFTDILERGAEFVLEIKYPK